LARPVPAGWCDRINPRVLPFWYYGLRGLSLVIVPFTQFGVVDLSIFYGLQLGGDWASNLCSDQPAVRAAR
jgi:hypothetical protein